VTIVDLRSKVLTGSLTPDGRQRYQNGLAVPNSGDTGQDLLLTNTDYGRSWIGVVRFDKTWDFGLTIGGAYTRQDVRDAGALTSSIASSNYGNSTYYDPNSISPGHANDEVRWAFRYNLSYEHAFFGDYKTRIDLFGTTRAGSPYSYAMQDLSGGRSGVFGTAGTNTGTCSTSRPASAIRRWCMTAPRRPTGSTRSSTVRALPPIAARLRRAMPSVPRRSPASTCIWNRKCRCRWARVSPCLETSRTSPTC
jgi:hypothetical protein